MFVFKNGKQECKIGLVWGLAPMGGEEFRERSVNMV
jgi:hypothetical protein